MVRIDVGERVTDGTGETKRETKKARRCDKKGFKADRYEAYQQKFFPTKYKKDQAEKKKNGGGAAVKEIKFDDSARKEFLMSFHKKKNERRVTAFVDAKKKLAKENRKFRTEQREEARKLYNTYAKVPILPNYTYRLPPTGIGAGPVSDDSEDEEEDEGEGEEAEAVYDGNGNLIAAAAAMEDDGHDSDAEVSREERRRLRAVRRRMQEQSHQQVVYSAPAPSASTPAATGATNNKKKSSKSSSSAAAATAVPVAAPAPVHRGLDDTSIVVTVEPLFGASSSVTNIIGSCGTGNCSSSNNNSAGHGKSAPSLRTALYDLQQHVSGANSSKNKKKLLNGVTQAAAESAVGEALSGGASSALGGGGSALPVAVARELAKIRNETKGPSQTPLKLKMLKELEKIRKIKKHSRKGHGKKSSGKAKKRNR